MSSSSAANLSAISLPALSLDATISHLMARNCCLLGWRPTGTYIPVERERGRERGREGGREGGREREESQLLLRVPARCTVVNTISIVYAMYYSLAILFATYLNSYSKRKSTIRATKINSVQTIICAGHTPT